MVGLWIFDSFNGYFSCLIALRLNPVTGLSSINPIRQRDRFMVDHRVLPVLKHLLKQEVVTLERTHSVLFIGKLFPLSGNESINKLIYSSNALLESSL